jgi:opacity protein-like surface antigen
MKKIAIIVFLLAVGVSAARAQESRQDFSVSGSVLIPPFRASQTDVQVSAQREFGMLASYRFMITPNSAVEANFGMTYQGKMRYVISNTNNYSVNNRTTEISGAYVRSFVFRNFNPFVEGGPAAFIFLPVRDQSTTSKDVQQQTEIGAIWGVGFAYEISPSFDIRTEFRGLVTKVPTFNAINNQFVTNKWYNIYDPTIGLAYHF